MHTPTLPYPTHTPSLIMCAIVTKTPPTCIATDQQNMATDYRDDARELVQSLLLSVIQKAIVEEGENQTQWPSINEFNQKSGEQAVETFIEVMFTEIL